MGGAGKVVAASKAQAQAQQQAEITSTESLELASALPLVHQLVILFYRSAPALNCFAGALPAARQHLSHRLSPRHLSPVVLQERGSCWPGRCSLLSKLMYSAPELLAAPLGRSTAEMQPVSCVSAPKQTA